MKTENLILVAALAFAGYMVAKTSGRLAPSAQSSYVPFLFNQKSTMAGQRIISEGYDPQDPGAYVSVDELIGEAARGGQSTLSPLFDQTLESVLAKRSGINMTG